MSVGGRIYAASTQNVGTTGSWQTIAFDTDDWDYSSVADNANNRLSLPQDGLYAIAAQMQNLAGVNYTYHMRLLVNSTVEIAGGTMNPNSGTGKNAVLGFYYASAGDTVELEVLAASTLAIGSGEFETWFAASLADYDLTKDAVSCKHSSNQSFSTGADLAVNFDSEHYDYGNMFSTGSSVVTIGTAGLYLITGHLYIQIPISNMSMGIRDYTNNKWLALKYKIAATGGSAFGNTHSVLTIADLSAGQEVGFRAYYIGGGGKIITAGWSHGAVTLLQEH